MRKLLSSVLACALGAGLVVSALSVPAAEAASTGNNAPQPGRIVSDNPVGYTPNVMDGAVLTLAKVGNLVYVGGTFTTVRNAGSSTDIARRNVFAFDATTGQVSTTFNPSPNSSVQKILPAGDGSLYLAGDFTSIVSAGSTVSASRLVKMSAGTGIRDAGFAPGSFNGSVRDLEVTGSRLWVAGKFTQVQGRNQRALGTINATTGAYDPFFTAVLAGLHRPELPGATTNVLKIATDPANSQLVAIGNFTTVNGATRHQIAKFGIGGASYTTMPWYTGLFDGPCSTKFETYMSDVNYSPDGSFFAIATTGAWGGSGSNSSTSGCDVVARFESNSTSTDDPPTWAAYTGGDTTWTLEVTDDVVYVGGHQRWQNNPSRGDAAGQGAVSREGIAALNTVNGMPYSWNPTRSRGVGIKDMLATEDGLYVGSDTNTFANESHYKLAFVPLSSGKDLPDVQPYTLPGDVFKVASGGSQLTRTGFDGSTITSGPSAAPSGPGWGTSVGAFMVDGILYTAYANGNLTKQTFDGTTYGPATSVDAADQLVRQTDWHNTDVPTITSLFYSGGRIYFTRSGQNTLYSRGFETESDVVGQLRYSRAAVSGVSYTTMRGAFVADGKLYFATTAGTLSAATWGGTGPVAGTAQPVPGAGGGWASRAMFVYQGNTIAPPGNQPPTASATVTCTLLTCTFDGSASTDDKGVTGYAWDFGDGDTGSGAVTTHTYASAGPRTVTLTVTDADGATGQTTRAINPTIPVPTTVSFVDANAVAGNRTNHTVTVPSSVQAGDQLLLFFTGNSTSATYTAPSGWTLQQTRAGDSTTGYLYAKIATAADAGSTVSISTGSAFVKDVMTVAAYRGGTLAESSSALDADPGTTHDTPSVSAADDQGWLVSYWAERSSVTTTWTLPSGVTQRSQAAGTPSGKISAVLGDSGGSVGAGSRGGLTATTDVATSSDVTMSVIIR